MREKTEKRHFAILRILQDADHFLSSTKITAQLEAMGYDTSGRTVRLHLQELDRKGLTKNFGKRGRKITPRGTKELSAMQTYEKVGFMAAKIDQLTYNMSFNVREQTGKVIINISLLPLAKLKSSIPLIKRVYHAGYAMGKLITLIPPGERVGELTIPENMAGIGTVCSITLNGILLAHGIPTNSRFGGLLEMQNREAKRFVELIHYDGTTIDPLEIFIRTGMTDYIGATSTGNGRIGAGFREVPADSRRQVLALAGQVEKIGLGGFLTIGWPGQPLLDIPVSEGRVGAIVIGGLNPIAILEEKGLRVQSRAMATLIDYSRLFSYQDLDDRAKTYL